MMRINMSGGMRYNAENARYSEHHVLGFLP